MQQRSMRGCESHVGGESVGSVTAWGRNVGHVAWQCVTWEWNRGTLLAHRVEP